jgi:AcrR family transcriptional regulator
MNETREYIIHTAFSLFLQKSYKEVTMKDIVEKTGLSKGAFYHYFNSKEQVFIEIAEQFIFSMLTESFRDLPEDSLQGFYRQYLHNIGARMQKIGEEERLLHVEQGKEGSGMNYYMLIFDAIRLLPEIRARIIEVEMKELETWKNAISGARKRGEIKSAMDDEQIAKIFIYTNDGVGMRMLLDGKMEDLGANIQKLWDAFYTDLQS